MPGRLRTALYLRAVVSACSTTSTRLKMVTTCGRAEPSLVTQVRHGELDRGWGVGGWEGQELVAGAQPCHCLLSWAPGPLTLPSGPLSVCLQASTEAMALERSQGARHGWVCCLVTVSASALGTRNWGLGLAFRACSG